MTQAQSIETKDTPLAKYGTDAEGLERLFREVHDELEAADVDWRYTPDNELRFTYSAEPEGCLIGSVVYMRQLHDTVPDGIIHRQFDDGVRIYDWEKVREALGYEPGRTFGIMSVEHGFIGYTPVSDEYDEQWHLGKKLRK